MPCETLMLAQVISIQIRQRNLALTCADIFSIFQIINFKFKSCTLELGQTFLYGHVLPRFQCQVCMLVSRENKGLME